MTTTEFPYLHGFSEVEQARLVRQAQIAESTVFHDIDYSGLAPDPALVEACEVFQR